jgi:hypothetical protein
VTRHVIDLLAAATLLLASCDAAECPECAVCPSPVVAQAKSGPGVDANPPSTPEASASDDEGSEKAEPDRVEPTAVPDGPPSLGKNPPASSWPRYRPPLLDSPPAKASIPAGDYKCRIGKEYKARACAVAVEGGHTRITIPEGGLIALEGVLYDEHDEVWLAGWPTEKRPFGCYSCQEKCSITPDECGCTEVPPSASRLCLAQPISAKLKATAKGWSGKMGWTGVDNNYAGTPPDRRMVAYELDHDEYVIQILR